MSTDNKPCINPIEEQRVEALKHYEEASNAIHHWSSFVSNAIKSYNPIPAPPQQPEHQVQGKEVQTAEVVNPSESDKAGGWLYNTDFLKKIVDKVNMQPYGEGLGMEEVESVLEAINFKHLHQTSQFKTTPTQEEQELYRWVKASERLPEVDAKYFVRYITSGTPSFIWLSLLKESAGVYEWLEKIPSEQLYSRTDVKPAQP